MTFDNEKSLLGKRKSQSFKICNLTTKYSLLFPAAVFSKCLFNVYFNTEWVQCENGNPTKQGEVSVSHGSEISLLHTIIRKQAFLQSLGLQYFWMIEPHKVKELQTPQKRATTNEWMNVDRPPQFVKRCFFFKKKKKVHVIPLFSQDQRGSSFMSFLLVSHLYLPRRSQELLIVPLPSAGKWGSPPTPPHLDPRWHCRPQLYSLLYFTCAPLTFLPARWPRLPRHFVRMSDLKVFGLHGSEEGEEGEGGAGLTKVPHSCCH